MNLKNFKLNLLSFTSGKIVKVVRNTNAVHQPYTKTFVVTCITCDSDSKPTKGKNFQVSNSLLNDLVFLMGETSARHASKC